MAIPSNETVHTIVYRYILGQWMSLFTLLFQENNYFAALYMLRHIKKMAIPSNETIHTTVYRYILGQWKSLDTLLFQENNYFAAF